MGYRSAHLSAHNPLERALNPIIVLAPVYIRDEPRPGDNPIRCPPSLMDNPGYLSLSAPPAPPSVRLAEEANLTPRSPRFRALLLITHARVDYIYNTTPRWFQIWSNSGYVLSLLLYTPLTSRRAASAVAVYRWPLLLVLHRRFLRLNDSETIARDGFEFVEVNEAAVLDGRMYHSSW